MTNTEKNIAIAEMLGFKTNSTKTHWKFKGLNTSLFTTLIKNDLHGGWLNSLLTNEKEAKWIITLKKIVADAGVNHTIIDVNNNWDLWRAALHIHESNIRMYVHCQAGANRTSMVCLISEIMRLGPELASKALAALVNEAISYGFDYHKEKYRQILTDILIQAKQQGLLFDWFLP